MKTNHLVSSFSVPGFHKIEYHALHELREHRNTLLKRKNATIGSQTFKSLVSESISVQAGYYLYNLCRYTEVTSCVNVATGLGFGAAYVCAAMKANSAAHSTTAKMFIVEERPELLRASIETIGRLNKFPGIVEVLSSDSFTDPLVGSTDMLLLSNTNRLTGGERYFEMAKDMVAGGLFCVLNIRASDEIRSLWGSMLSDPGFQFTTVGPNMTGVCVVASKSVLQDNQGVRVLEEPGVYGPDAERKLRTA